VATKKTSSETSSPGTSSGKAKATPDPVIIEPPKKKPATGKAADTIDAKAVDVSETPKPKKPRPAPAKAATEKPSDQKTPPPPEPPAKDRKGSPAAGLLAAALVGGIIAGAIGWYIGRADLPVAVPDLRPELAEMEQNFQSEISALKADIEDLRRDAEKPVATQVGDDLRDLAAGLEARTVSLSARMDGYEAEFQSLLETLESSRSRLSDRVAEAGGDLGDVTQELLADLEAEIEVLKQELAQQAAASQGYRDGLNQRVDEIAAKATEQLSEARQKVSDLSAQAVEAAKNIDLADARARLNAALETGNSYSDHLRNIVTGTSLDVPEVLQSNAASGLATLAELQADYPASARAALKASIAASADDNIGGRVTAFLKSQLGARSLEPREGDDPDAVLSRAEAALGRGELQSALEILNDLPEAGRAEMASWMDRAMARLAAEQALQEFNAAIDGQGQDSQ